MSELFNFPFWKVLSKEGQQALEILKRMKDMDESLGRASKWITGRSWDGTKLTRCLNGVARTMQGLGIRHVETEAMIATGKVVAEASAASAAAGGGAAGGGLLWGMCETIGGWFGLGGGAAVAAGAAVVTVAMAVPTYYASDYLGDKYGYENVAKLGWRRLMDHERPPTDKPGDVGSGQTYGVWVAGNDVLVGAKEVIESTPCGSLRGWGMDYSVTVKQRAGELQNIGGKTFGTYDEAVARYREMLDPASVSAVPNMAGNYVKAMVGGKEYNIVNAP